ncbi:MAG: trypsin-like peptidase domain-containing protein [Candidatus Saccharibacteria bacterium]|nr:trypsin-like peptidase domain-containing protein [Candidatus Saccharibacteria bacterium]
MESEKGKKIETEKTKQATPEPESTVAADSASATSKTANKTAITLSILALIFGCVGLALGWMGYSKSSTPLTFLGGGTDGNSANFVEGSIAEVADKVSKSVVSIVTSTKTTDFFGQSYDSAAAGTGIIVTEDGYVLTNKHVINGATKVTVVLDDGTTYEDVKVVATDPLNDVAYLKIDNASGLTAAKLGDSKTINVGQQVIAIGNALGQYQNTVTSGIVSGLGRSVTASDGSSRNTETLTDMIQTDAAINSGNSGGPLVNAAGEVIGINTATSTSAENMGFAIPISSTKGMLQQLIETGSAKRTYLGVYSIEITPEVAKAYNLPVSEGVYLYSPSSYSAIVKNSPAAKAGLKDKDIITAINGVKVGATGSLANIIGEYKPGDTVQLTVVREGNETAINVTLEAYPE